MKPHKVRRPAVTTKSTGFTLPRSRKLAMGEKEKGGTRNRKREEILFRKTGGGEKRKSQRCSAKGDKGLMGSDK